MPCPVSPVPALPNVPRAPFGRRRVSASVRRTAVRCALCRLGQAVGGSPPRDEPASSSVRSNARSSSHSRALAIPATGQPDESARSGRLASGTAHTSRSHSTRTHMASTPVERLLPLVPPSCSKLRSSTTRSLPAVAHAAAAYRYRRTADVRHHPMEMEVAEGIADEVEAPSTRPPANPPSTFTRRGARSGRGRLRRRRPRGRWRAAGSRGSKRRLPTLPAFSTTS